MKTQMKYLAIAVSIIVIASTASVALANWGEQSIGSSPYINNPNNKTAVPSSMYLPAIPNASACTGPWGTVTNFHNSENDPLNFATGVSWEDVAITNPAPGSSAPLTFWYGVQSENILSRGNALDWYWVWAWTDADKIGVDDSWIQWDMGQQVMNIRVYPVFDHTPAAVGRTSWASIVDGYKAQVSADGTTWTPLAATQQYVNDFNSFMPHDGVRDFVSATPFRYVRLSPKVYEVQIDAIRACQVAVVATTAQCADGIDNDGDGAVDMSDFSCSSVTDTDETNPRSMCQDGVDNDGDGLTDFPQDPGCADRQDNNETNAAAACQDGVDNDGDGATDFPSDFSCSSATDTDETNPRSMCQDGVDNDGDGLTDFPQDPGCADRQDNNETNAAAAAQCQDGIDNDGDGAVDMADFSCSSATDTDETNPRSICQDGVDNDGDGLTDFPQDSGCASRQDNDESNVTGAIACSNNAQCGTGQFVGAPFCQGNSVFRNVTNYTCVNPGTTSSFCSPTSTSGQFQNNCAGNLTCSNGICGSSTTNYVQNAYKACFGNTSFWYDSNNIQQGVFQVCTGNQVCQGGNCVTSGTNQGQAWVSTNVMIRNLTAGNLVYGKSINASPSDILQVQATISSNVSQTINNVVVRKIFPANLFDGNNVTVDGVANSGSISSGINIGSIAPGQTRIVTFYAQVAAAQNFAFGTTTILDPVEVTSTDPGFVFGAANGASILVTRGGVAGVTNVPTGLTNNPWVDSFILPLLLALAGVWLYKSGLIAMPAWVGGRMSMNKNRAAEAKLQQKIAEIKNRENS